MAGSLLAFGDELETSAEDGFAESLSTFKLARSPLSIYHDTEIASLTLPIWKD